MDISFKDSFYLKKIQNKSGAFGYLATHPDLSNDLVIKIINNLSINKINLLEELLNHPYIENSGYPIDIFKINGAVKGYIMKYFTDSYTFDYLITRDNFNHQERVSASIKCSKQLKEFHSYNMLFNDISSRNQLIDKNGGHLIDFDASTNENTSSVETSLYLILNGKALLPSKSLDKLKQALVNLSLIYQIDLEEMINDKSNDIKEIFNLFKSNKEIYNLLYSYLNYNDVTPYFDILMNSLQDEEKVAYEKATIYRKVLNLN